MPLFPLPSSFSSSSSSFLSSSSLAMQVGEIRKDLIRVLFHLQRKTGEDNFWRCHGRGSVHTPQRKAFFTPTDLPSPDSSSTSLVSSSSPSHVPSPFLLPFSSPSSSSSSLPSSVKPGEIQTSSTSRISSSFSLSSSSSSSVSNFLFQRSPVRYAGHKHSESILQQFYNRLPVRKRFLKAIRKGTLIWDKGQVKIPPIAMQGYALPRKLVLPHQREFNQKLPKFKGHISQLKSPRIWYQD